MPRARTVLAVLALTSSATTAHAADSEPPRTPWTARLYKGTSPGEPSAVKVATVVTLYSAGVASLAGGLVFTLNGIDAGTDADEFARRQPSGFCADRGSDACARYLRYRRDESDQLLFGQALFGAGALLAVSGALTAELWPNRAPFQISATAVPGAATVGFSTAF